MEAKACTLCGVLKPLSDYGVQSNVKDGRKSRCKPCLAALSRKYNADNPEKRRLIERSWRERNPDKVKAMGRRSRVKNAEGYRRRLREFYKRNPKRVYALKRRAAIRNLPNDYSPLHSRFMYDIFGGCALTGAKFNLHDDHFVAISTGHGGTYIGNMVPMAAELNLSKGSQNPFEWIETRPDIDRSKFDKAVDYLAQFNRMTIDEYRTYVYYCYDNPVVTEVKPNVKSS